MEKIMTDKTEKTKRPLERIEDWSWPSYTYEPDGRDMKTVPDLSVANLKFLADELNMVIDRINGSE